MSAEGWLLGLLLWLGVLVAICASVGAVLVPGPRQRLHLLAMVTSVSGPLVGAALAIHDGLSTSAGQVVLIVLLLSLSGPVLAVATARLAFAREPGEEDDGP